MICWSVQNMNLPVWMDAKKKGLPPPGKPRGCKMVQIPKLQFDYVRVAPTPATEPPTPTSDAAQDHISNPYRNSLFHRHMNPILRYVAKVHWLRNGKDIVSPELYTEGYPYFVRGRDSLRTHIFTLFQSQLVLYDGAMGAMIQNYAKWNMLEDEELRGDRFMNWTCNVKGKNDMLSISQSQVIQEIYRQCLEIGGSNIICTNTFSYTTIAMAD
jgi:hypothetical protein